MIKARTENKPTLSFWVTAQKEGARERAEPLSLATTDTEIFVVKDQLEYETIVKIAKIFSDEMENRSNNLTLKEIEWEKEKLEYEKRCLQMERELMQAHV